jgi:hypothetical protein
VKTEQLQEEKVGRTWRNTSAAPLQFAMAEETEASARRDKYAMLHKVGEGTFGEVWKAEEKATGKIVAIKEIKLVRGKDGVGLSAIDEIRLMQVHLLPHAGSCVLLGRGPWVQCEDQCPIDRSHADGRTQMIRAMCLLHTGALSSKCTSTSRSFRRQVLWMRGRACCHGKCLLKCEHAGQRPA